MLRPRPPRPLPAPAVGQAPSRTILLVSQNGKRLGLYAAVAALTYGAALLVFMPARAALALSGTPRLWTDVAGSAWDGQAAFGDRLRLAWDADAGASLARGALAADLEGMGADTQVTGRARLRPGSVELVDVRGAAGWPLVAGLIPRAPLSCDMEMRVDLDRLAFGGERQGVEGRLDSGPATCRPTVAAFSAAPFAVPALSARATSDDAASRVVLAPRDNRGDPLATAVLTRSGRFSLTVLPAGSALIPLGQALPTRFERQL